MAKLLALSCWRNLSPRPHYPSMPKYPKGQPATTVQELSDSTALFSVVGMTCAACAGSVEKAVKRLPGIREAIVDVLNNRAHVIFYPSFVNVSQTHSLSILLLLIHSSTFFFVLSGRDHSRGHRRRGFRSALTQRRH